MLIALKYGLRWKDSEALQNAPLKLWSENLSVRVHQEVASNGIEDHTPTRPLFIFGIVYSLA